jgi:MerR family copper efflux transcriptional regulator
MRPCGVFQLQALVSELVELPVACNLNALDAGSQLDGWRQLFAEFRTSRVSQSHLVVRVGGTPATVADVIALVQREKACCPFFEFSLQVEADVVVLHVSVPEEATSILDALIDA